MPSQAPPPPSQPAGVPTSGSSRYVVIAVALLGVIGAAVAWKMSQKPPEPPVIFVDAGPPTPRATGRNLDDDVPLPPPVEDAGSDDGGKKVIVTQSNNQCDVKKCSGTAGTEVENALKFRSRQAHRCYDTALAQDPSLHGKMTVQVRVGSNGQVCSAVVTSNELGSQYVASCVADKFRGASFPAPKGGCIDVAVPINFVPGQ